MLGLIPLRHATWQAWAPPDANAVAIGLQSLLETFFIRLSEAGAALLRVLALEETRLSESIPLLSSACQAGLRVELSLSRPSDWLKDWESVGIHHVLVQLDGADGPTHNAIRKVQGSYLDALGLLEQAQAQGWTIHIQTTLHPSNLWQLRQLHDQVSQWKAHSWLVGPLPNCPALGDPLLEKTLAELARWTQHSSVRIVTQYAPFFYRFCTQLGSQGPWGLEDERAGLCVLANGEITPDPSLDLAVARLAQELSPRTLFDSHPLLRALHDPDSLEGKCGRCPYRQYCGGSRARSYARTGSLFASDPACSFCPNPLAD